MLRTLIQKNPSSFIEKTQLNKLKLNAMRAGAWFRNLRRIDRALINLTIMVSHNNIRSPTLTRGILSIVTKLEGLLERNLSKVTRDVGFPLAKKASLIAQHWGNPFAHTWRSDLPFATFLAILTINNPKKIKPTPRHRVTAQTFSKTNPNPEKMRR